MFRRAVLCATVAVFLLTSAASAGGPPYLCVPVDGITTDNLQACEDLLQSSLKDKIWKHSDHQNAVQLRDYKNQWYMTFYMEQDVSLSELEKILHGSDFSIPRDKLRLFGHVVLEIEASDQKADQLLDGLKAMDQVAVENSRPDQNQFLIAVDMPYPETDNSHRDGDMTWKTYRRNGLNSDPRDGAEITGDKLPTLNAFHEVVKKHDAQLKDIRWSVNYRCRHLGAVVEEPKEQVTSTK